MSAERFTAHRPLPRDGTTCSTPGLKGLTCCPCLHRDWARRRAALSARETVGAPQEHLSNKKFDLHDFLLHRQRSRPAAALPLLLAPRLALRAIACVPFGPVPACLCATATLRCQAAGVVVMGLGAASQ